MCTKNVKKIKLINVKKIKLLYINYSRRLIIYNKAYTCEHVQYLMTAILTGAMQVTVFMIEIRVVTLHSITIALRSTIYDLRPATLRSPDRRREFIYVWGGGRKREGDQIHVSANDIYIYRTR